MKYAALLFAAAVATAPVAALAQSNGLPSAPSLPDPSAVKPGQDKVICRSENEVGSRIATKKVCLTAAQWRERQFRAGQWAEQQTTYNTPIR